MDALRTELAYECVPISVTLIKPAAIATPYAEHAENYLPDQPTHSAPVYAPRSVARAILYAAEHPVREMSIGSGGKVLTIANAIAPSLVDAFMTRFLLPQTHSGRLPHTTPALYRPTENLRERGEYPGLVRPSLYTVLRTRPSFATALAFGAAMALGAWKGANRETADTRR